MSEGYSTRVAVVESEVERLRTRTHDHASTLYGLNTSMEVVKTEVNDVKDDVAELKEKLADLHDGMDKRFDKLGSQGWKIAGFVISVFVLAATIVSLVV